MPDPSIEPGSFPYPISDGTGESRYLTWVRNHSNYLTPRGFLDYLRAAAVLVRGILVNFLTLLPWLLLGSLLVSAWHNGRLDAWADVGEIGEPGFVLTRGVAIATLLYFLLFPIVLRLFRVRQHSQSIQEGSESSVKMRDLYERSFGFGFLLIGITAALDVFPLLLHLFHALHDGSNSVRGLVAGGVATSSVAAVSVAGRVLSALGGSKKRLAIWGIGLLGTLLPLLVVLYVAEMLVYEEGPWLESGPPWMVLYVVTGGLFAAGLLSFAYGTRQVGARASLFIVVPLLTIAATGAGIWYASGATSTVGDAQWLFVIGSAVTLWLYSWLSVDVNLTSVNGFYRDRLASAYLVGQDSRGDVDIEHDLNLGDICQHENGSTAPYHLVNTALNLQGSKDIGIRDRNSDFFVFSKRFVGGRMTGYASSRELEAVFPQMDLATAMAISAAAASPNMGRGTSPPLVAIMTLLNVRLGYWVPNPRHLTPWAYGQLGKKGGQADPSAPKARIDFPDVFETELTEVVARWRNAYPEDAEGGGDRALTSQRAPTTAHGLVGLAFSGGGIRSATVNLGVVQALERAGVFRHVDYMSTVSGGGYLGSSLSTLMRAKTFAAARPEPSPLQTLPNRFRWRVRPSALVREVSSRLDETSRWVNLSDGGHIENLATIELLRRRCKYIITGDAEADPTMRFPGLATLMRFARIDLGIEIDINVKRVGLHRDAKPGDRRSEQHFAVGTIHYPGEAEPGYLLYFKSSVTGDEDEVIAEYGARNPTFPHESTADQFFDEGQFEAYRSLGQHMATTALAASPGRKESYAELQSWFEALIAQAPKSA